MTSPTTLVTGTRNKHELSSDIGTLYTRLLSHIFNLLTFIAILLQNGLNRAYGRVSARLKCQF